MRSDWRDETLSEFVSLQRGHDLPEYDRRSGSVPVVGSFGITGWHDQPRAEGPGVAVGRSGASFGVVSFCREDYWPLNTVLYVTDFRGNDARFAYYLLKAIDFKRFNSGSAQPSLNRNHIANIKVRIPPLPEQRRIAEILGALDDKIELNRRMNETLEALVRTSFKSCFANSTLIGKGRAEPNTLKDVIVELRRGVSPKYLDSGGVRVVNQKCIRDGWLSFQESRRHDPVRGRSTDGLLLNVGDILINSTGVGTLGRVAQVHALDEDTVCDSHVTMIRANTRVVEPLYLGTLLRLNEETIESMGEGTTGQTELSRARLGSLIINVPPLIEQRRFVEAAAPMTRLQACNAAQSDTLASTRDSLLPKLISGDLSPL